MATDYLINVKDADLMQMMYQQDVDLGFDWHHLNAPEKMIKDVDETQKEKLNMVSNDFFVDGETGEQIPIKQPALSTVYANLQQTQAISTDSQLNIDECLEILEHSSGGIPTQQSYDMISVRGGNNTMDNYMPEINTTENNTTFNKNQNVWQQVDGNSALNSFNLQARTPPHLHVPQTQNLLHTNTTPPYGHLPFIESPVSDYNQQPYSPVMEQSYEPVFEPQIPHTYVPAINFPTPSYTPPMHTPPSYTGSPVNSDDGMAMDVGYPSVDRQDPFGQFHNFRFTNDPGSSLPFGRSPSLESLPEPGQGFFNTPTSNPSSNFSELVPVNSTLTSFSNNMTGSYLNPPLAPHPPPPLTRSPPIMGYSDSDQGISSTIDEGIISEYHESDSGMPLESSPKGFGHVVSNAVEDLVFSRATCVKPESANHTQLHNAQDLKNVQQNRSIATMKKPANKKNIMKDKSNQSRESRDEKKARELNIPFSLDEIILSPVEDYNEMMIRTPLTPTQQALIKDIRRRGKNKVAAQNCRKRKIETITTMEEDVEMLRSRKQQLVEEQKDLETKHKSVKRHYNSLYQRIFTSLRDESGRPYDSNRFRLEQVEEAVVLVPCLFQDKNITEQGNLNGQLDFSKVKLESV